MVQSKNIFKEMKREFNFWLINFEQYKKSVIPLFFMGQQFAHHECAGAIFATKSALLAYITTPLHNNKNIFTFQKIFCCIKTIVTV